MECCITAGKPLETIKKCEKIPLPQDKKIDCHLISHHPLTPLETKKIPPKIKKIFSPSHSINEEDLKECLAAKARECVGEYPSETFRMLHYTWENYCMDAAEKAKLEEPVVTGNISLTMPSFGKASKLR